MTKDRHERIAGIVVAAIRDAEGTSDTDRAADALARIVSDLGGKAAAAQIAAIDRSSIAETMEALVPLVVGAKGSDDGAKVKGLAKLLALGVEALLAEAGTDPDTIALGGRRKRCKEAGFAVSAATRRHLDALRGYLTCLQTHGGIVVTPVPGGQTTPPIGCSDEFARVLETMGDLDAALEKMEIACG